MLQQRSFVYLRALYDSSFCCSLCLCGEEVFSIEQLSDESYRVHRRPGHELPIISYPQAGDWRLKTVLLAASGDGFPGFLVGGAAALGFALIP
jgi:hypothetical protein